MSTPTITSYRKPVYRNSLSLARCFLLLAKFGLVAPQQPASTCCRDGETSVKPWNNCRDFYNCLDGVVIDLPTPCVGNTQFSFLLQRCEWPDVIEEQGGCKIDDCAPTAAPTSTPSTATPTSSPSASPTGTPPPTNNPTTSPTFNPTNAPSANPTAQPEICCPAGYSGLRPWDECKQFYSCDEGIPNDAELFSCTDGLIFDELTQTCNWPRLVDCFVGACEPTSSPSEPPVINPTSTPVQTPSDPSPVGVAPIPPLSFLPPSPSSPPPPAPTPGSPPTTATGGAAGAPTQPDSPVGVPELPPVTPGTPPPTLSNNSSNAQPTLEPIPGQPTATQPFNSIPGSLPPPTDQPTPLPTFPPTPPPVTAQPTGTPQPTFRPTGFRGGGTVNSPEPRAPSDAFVIQQNSSATTFEVLLWRIVVGALVVMVA